MATPERSRPRGLRIHDLVGLVVGYGMAALLARAFWPRSRPLSGIPAVALGFELVWLGLAMSGPVVLLLERRGGSNRPERPRRPGRLISSKEPTEAPAPAPPDPESRYTRAELAWMMIGGYWISLTLFVVPLRSIDGPWALAGLLQIVAALGTLVIVPRRAVPGPSPGSWTQIAALSLLYTWPVAWILLIALGGSF